MGERFRHGLPLTVSRRTALLGALSVPIAGCMQVVMDPEVARDIVVRRVIVDMSAVELLSTRTLPITSSEFGHDLASAVRQELGPRFAETGNADLYLKIKRVFLVSEGYSLMFGGRSFIRASVVVLRAEDRTRVGELKDFTGFPLEARLGGILGAMNTPGPQEDYRATLAGFASMLEDALFEGGAPIG